jgi:hypothetical protein
MVAHMPPPTPVVNIVTNVGCRAAQRLDPDLVEGSGVSVTRTSGKWVTGGNITSWSWTPTQPHSCTFQAILWELKSHSTKRTYRVSVASSPWEYLHATSWKQFTYTLNLRPTPHEV